MMEAPCPKQGGRHIGASKSRERCESLMIAYAGTEHSKQREAKFVMFAGIARAPTIAVVLANARTHNP
jgi:hypothetical protein